MSDSVSGHRWESMDEGAAAWDAQLEGFESFTLYQEHAWGEHRRAQGWRPHRWLARDGSGKAIAAVQGLHRSLPGGGAMVWATGIGSVSLPACGESLRQRILRDTGARWLYVRLSFTVVNRPEDEQQLRDAGWRPVSHRLRTGFSMRLDLSRSEEELSAALSKNWRRNLRRAEKRDDRVERWERPDLDEILALYASMEQHKEIAQQFSAEELSGLFRHFSDRIALFAARSASGELLAIRGCTWLGHRAWDLFAATGPEGRNAYSAYRCCWEMLLDARRRGVQGFDFMGVEPSEESGVFLFKRGTGAELIEYLGEWEWASLRPIAWAANRVLRSRSGT
jgi:lipid II:glycine glycyltransferase (peptidoglycan interpeptide bridge formation enzyme)